MNLLQDSFSSSLIAQLDPPGDIGVAITGSYARGESQKHSDMDLNIFVSELPAATYTLRLFNGKLVSLKYLLLKDEYEALTRPERAIWAVPGLKQMQILQDKKGEIAKLKQAAFGFNWAGLQKAADEYAAEKLMGCAEEAHKIISGLAKNHESKVLYASSGMFYEMAFSTIVQAGLMIDSENRAF